MPIYEYQCQACGHQLEIMQKISDEPLSICPKCQKPSLNKLISAAGFQLKGTGWYATDFKTKPKNTSESTSTTGSSDASSKTSSSGSTSE